MSEISCALTVSYSNARTLVFVETEVVYALSNRKTIVDAARELKVSYVFDVVTSTGTLRIPMQSFQSRLRNDGISYLTAYVPGGTAYKGKVLVGQMMYVRRVVEFTDGTKTESEICRSKITDVTPSLSPNNSTMTVGGSLEYPKPASPKSLSLSNILYVAFYDAEVSIRITPNSELQPGDIISYDGTDYIATEIVMFVESTANYCEVRGAPR